eukprot:8153384-Prorocentrum_lima.AAC.1
MDSQEHLWEVTRAPTTLVGLANLSQEYVHGLELGMRLGSLMEPRAIHSVVRDTMGTVVTVVPKDDLLKKILQS